MPTDSITDEIRGIRHELAEHFGNDLAAILADLRKREATDGRTYVSLPARRIRQGSTDPNNAPEAAGPANSQ